MQPECNLREVLGERLKQARAALGKTQKELCFQIGLPLQSLKDYEGSKRLPGAEALCAYASAGIRVDWLLTGEGSMRLADQVAAAPPPPAPQPVSEFDQIALQACIQAVLEAKRNATPAQQARMISEFYARMQALQMEKPAAA
jgi:transcriptional regulator with XRE-family HTH domain